jgi:hypothetical protein
MRRARASSDPGRTVLHLTRRQSVGVRGLVASHLPEVARKRSHDDDGQTKDKTQLCRLGDRVADVEATEVRNVIPEVQQGRQAPSGELGERLYRQHSHTIEPMFGHTKHNRRMSRFHRRGRSAVRTEWRLIAATHNLLKLHSHTLAAAMA